MTNIKTWIKENSKYLFIVFAFLVFLSTFTSLDQDLYWHIKNGESLLEHGISNKDYFSYWGGNYIAHEWLYDIFLFFLNQTFTTESMVTSYMIHCAHFVQ